MRRGVKRDPPFDWGGCRVGGGIRTNCKGKVASRNMSISPTLFIYSRIVVMSGMGGFYFLFFGFEALNAQKKFWGNGGGRELHFEKSSVRCQYNMVLYRKFVVI